MKHRHSPQPWLVLNFRFWLSQYIFLAYVPKHYQTSSQRHNWFQRELCALRFIILVVRISKFLLQQMLCVFKHYTT